MISTATRSPTSDPPPLRSALADLLDDTERLMTGNERVQALPEEMATKALDVRAADPARFQAQQDPRRGRSPAVAARAARSSPRRSGPRRVTCRASRSLRPSSRRSYRGTRGDRLGLLVGRRVGPVLGAGAAVDHEVAAGDESRVVGHHPGHAVADVGRRRGRHRHRAAHVDPAGVLPPRRPLTAAVGGDEALARPGSSPGCRAAARSASRS